MEAEDREPVRCCVICGAVLTEGTTAMHNQWHDRLTVAVSEAKSGLGFMFGEPGEKL